MRVRNAVLVAVLVLLALGGAETAYRYWLIRDALRNDQLHQVTVYSETMTYSAVDSARGIAPTPPDPSDIALFKKNRKVQTWYYGRNAELATKFAYPLNNVGLISSKDYTVERGPDEYRILVLGDEMTAATTAEISWPDLLEDGLNSDTALTSRIGKTFKVFNLGWPDAGFFHFANVWKTRGQNLAPDMVIINVVKEDYFRMAADGARPTTYRGKPIQGFVVSYDLGEGEDDRVHIVAVGTRPSESLADLNTTVPLPFAVFVSPALGDDRRMIATLQKRLHDDFVGAVVWGSRRPLSLQHLIGRKFDPLKERRFDPTPSTQLTEQQMLDHARKHLLSIVDTHPNVVLTRNVHLSEIPPSVPFAFSDKLAALDPKLTVVDMRNYLPAHRSEQEAKSWYHYPFMPAKWSPKGHEIYAQAMAELVRQRLTE